MKMRFILLVFAAVIFTAVLPSFADNGTVVPEASENREPIWPTVKKEPAESVQTTDSTKEQASGKIFSSSREVVEEGPYMEDAELLFTNFNNAPVKNKPTHYFPLSLSSGSVLVTKVRTYHWNSGNGSVPGTIGIYDTATDTRVCGGQAVGMSANGTSNVFWEALMECPIYPGTEYRVKVSDDASWSYNDGSNGAGMFELYGISPIPEDYVPAPQQNDSYASSDSSSSSGASKDGFRVTYNGNNCLAKVPADSNLYQAGKIVTVLFDPVEYMPGLIFYGWDSGGDGVADYGYSYNTFTMPAEDVELRAICIGK